MTAENKPGVVESWFGEGFSQLHPLLQRLHREGGALAGQVTIDHGKGVAGWLGRRIATRLGIPSSATTASLKVRIQSVQGALHWNRVFDDSSTMTSVFTPVGTWPEGCWIERTGPLRLALGVDTAGGGWRWVPLGMSVMGIPLPSALSPRVSAYKRVESGQYRFGVEAWLPVFGKLFSYTGVLSATSRP